MSKTSTPVTQRRSAIFWVDAPPLRKLHISERKSSKQVYRRFLQNVKLPVTLLDQMYDSRYARHFYSPDEIARLRRKWGQDLDMPEAEGTAERRDRKAAA